MDAIEMEIKGLGSKIESYKSIAEKAGVDAAEAKAAFAKVEETLKGVTTADQLELAKKEMQDQVDAIVLKMKDAQNERKGKLRSFEVAFEEAYNAKKAEIDEIVAKSGRQSGPLVFEVKDAVTIGIDNTIGAGATHYTLTANTGIISPIRKRVLRYLQNVAVGFMSPLKPYAMWIEETDEQGTPIFIGEGDAKTQLSVLYVEREMKAKKIAVYGKVTTEMLRYLPQLIAYIQNNLMKRLDIKTEDQLFSGDGLGDNLKGSTVYATAFTGSDLAGTIISPNNYDVIRAVALQSENAFGMPNGIFVHPSTVAEMDLSKDNEGRYLLPPFVTAAGKTIAGMEIIPTNALDAGEFLGGDLSVINVFFTQNMTVQVGLDGNDFTTNKKTILVEQELVQFVSANDTQVLITGDFTTAKAALAAA